MEKLLILAKEDLDSSSLLLKESKFPNAFYHYHQSVEKTTKYVGLKIGGISEQQLFEIRHDPLKVFSKLLNYWTLTPNRYLHEVDIHIITNLKQIFDKNNDQEAITLIINSIKLIKKEPLKINVKQFSSPFEALCDYAERTKADINFDLENELSKKYAVVALKENTNDLINAINYGTKIISLLFMNSLVCTRYSPDQLRYPSKKISNPISFFSNAHPLIKNLPTLIITMKTSIEMSSQIKWNLHN